MIKGIWVGIRVRRLRRMIRGHGRGISRDPVHAANPVSREIFALDRRLRRKGALPLSEIELHPAAARRGPSGHPDATGPALDRELVGADVVLDRFLPGEVIDALASPGYILGPHLGALEGVCDRRAQGGVLQPAGPLCPDRGRSWPLGWESRRPSCRKPSPRGSTPRSPHTGSVPRAPRPASTARQAPRPIGLANHRTRSVSTQWSLTIQS